MAPNLASPAGRGVRCSFVDDAPAAAAADAAAAAADAAAAVGSAAVLPASRLLGRDFGHPQDRDDSLQHSQPQSPIRPTCRRTEDQRRRCHPWTGARRGPDAPAAVDVADEPIGVALRAGLTHVHCNCQPSGGAVATMKIDELEQMAATLARRGADMVGRKDSPGWVDPDARPVTNSASDDASDRDESTRPASSESETGKGEYAGAAAAAGDRQLGVD